MGENCSVSLSSKTYSFSLGGRAWGGGGGGGSAGSPSPAEHEGGLQCIPRQQGMGKTCSVSLGGKAWGRPAVSPSEAKYRGDLPHQQGMRETPLSSVATHAR